MDKTVSTGYMVMPVLKINKLIEKADVEIVGRYDWFDKDNDSASLNDAVSDIIAGFNFNIYRNTDDGKPLVFIQTNWDRKMYEDTSKSAVDNVSIQLRWIFSGTI